MNNHFIEVYEYKFSSKLFLTSIHPGDTLNFHNKSPGLRDLRDWNPTFTMHIIIPSIKFHFDATYIIISKRIVHPIIQGERKKLCLMTFFGKGLDIREHGFYL